MSVLQESQIKAYCSFPVCLLPDGTDEIFLATADGGNHFLDFGIHEGIIAGSSRHGDDGRQGQRYSCPVTGRAPTR